MSGVHESAGGSLTVIGLGASAGGVEALTTLVGGLPVDLTAAVFVVLHVSPAGTSALGQILDRAGPLPAQTATDGAEVTAGRIYVAPPDRHLLVEDGVIRLSPGPRENGHRPAVDPTFRALAAYGRRAIGVILSGTRDDGTAGLASIKRAGGQALVQAPGDAAYDGMIRSALAHVEVDVVLPVAELAARLVRMSDPLNAMTEDPSRALERPEPPEESSTRYTCPDCGGHLHREHDGDLVRFLCEIGHKYSPDSLDGEQALAVENAMWTAARLLGDRAALLREMSERARERGHARSAEGFQRQAEEAQRAGDTLRGLLVGGMIPTPGGREAAA